MCIYNKSCGHKVYAVCELVVVQVCECTFRPARDSRIFDESQALTPHSENLTHFPAQRKTIFLMSQVFSFCGEKLEYTYVRLIDSVCILFCKIITDFGLDL